MTERVQKTIAASGLTSRRKAEEMIEQGRVAVNGVRITLGDKADPETDTITVDGEPLHMPERVYYMVHKPKGYVTTTKDPYAKRKIVDLVPRNPPVYPVGRLDKDATGVLLMTNDGDFKNNIAHPSNNVSKTYIAVLKSPLTDKQLIDLQKGVVLDGRRIHAKAIRLKDDTVAITIQVGLHKVVKRMIKSVGSYVKHLHRTHVGNLALDVLEGQYRELSKEDIKQLFKPVTISAKTFTQ